MQRTEIGRYARFAAVAHKRYIHAKVECYVLCYGGTVHIVIPPHRRAYFEVHGIYAFFGKLAYAEIIIYLRGGVI